MAAGGKRRSFYADLDHMRNLFDSVDANKTGYVGYQELCALVRNIPEIEEAAVPELMKQLDRDKDGKVSFDDFEVLFAQEREEAKKKQKLNPGTDGDQVLDHSGYQAPLSSIQEYPVAPEASTPLKLTLHTEDNDASMSESPSVVLRHKVSRRATLPASWDGPEYLSPIHAERQRKRASNELPDLATQMRYLTDVSSSPQLKRDSKVLSWINESGDMFDLEGTGQLRTGVTESDGMSSPPLSPTRTSSDEATNIKAILESVCHTDKIDREAIAQLCKHVKADPQEQSELLTLLSHLDKEKLGYVSLDDFVRGLQFIHNTAVVASTPPPSRTASLRRTHSEFIQPPYFGTPTSSHPPPSFLASTPLPTGGMFTTDTTSLLTVLDPDHSGVVKVNNLISQWQQMGVEAPHDTSLEDALTEMVTVDPAGRVNVSELATSLEEALLSEESKSNVLRQVALKLYKTEISALRTKVHHVSLERDTLRNSLNRTLEENKKLIKEGDEHADLVQQQSEQKLKETEAQLTDRLQKEKRSREEEARQMQERAAGMIQELEKELEKMRGNEEELRRNLKLQQDECNIVNSELQKANRVLDLKEKTIQMLQRDLGYHSELNTSVDGTHATHLRELEERIAESSELINNLREGVTEMQDKYDLLVAENEKLKQKYLSQKRSMLRRSSPKVATEVKTRHSVGERPARPRSGSLSGRSPQKKPRLPQISYKLDLATEGSHHSALWEEEVLEDENSSEEMEEKEAVKVYRDESVDEERKPMSEESTPDEDDDFFARSTASLMHEFQVEEDKKHLENEIEKLRKENTKLILNMKELEQQLNNTEGDTLKSELQYQLQQSIAKQQELEQYITELEKQRHNLSAGKMEVIGQLAEADVAIAKQSLIIEELKLSQSNSRSKVEELTDELERSRVQLEEEKVMHEDLITSLKQQISNLEECNDSQTEQCLRLEEDKANAERELTVLQKRLESERQSSETQVNILTRKLRSLEESQADLVTKSELQLKEVQGELLKAQEMMKEFEQRAACLEVQLKEAKEAIGRDSEVNKQEVIVTKEIISVEKSPFPEQVSMENLTASLEKFKKECTQLNLLNEQLQSENAERRDTEKRMHAEIQDLHKQLSNAEKELTDQSDVYMNEMKRIKDDIDSERELNAERTALQVAEMHSSLTKQMDDLTHTYELKLEAVKQELEESESERKSLQHKLSDIEVQNKNLVVKVADLTESEAELRRLTDELKHGQSKSKSEIAQLKADLVKYQEELSFLKTSVASTPEKEFKRKDSFADIDFIPTTRSPKRSPYKPDSEAQGKLITQMKSRLEELQRLLLKSRQAEGGEAPSAELGLIQELLANNSALDSAAKQLQNDYETKNQELWQSLASKDNELKNLQSEIDKKHEALGTMTSSTMKKLMGRMDNFHGNSNESLDAYRARIEAAATMLESISAIVHNQGKRHVRALETVLSDLDRSHSEVCSYKDEMERLRAQLDHSSLYDTDQDQRATNGLAVQNISAVGSETAPSPGSSKRRVDEGSGQVIDDIDDAQSRVSLLQQKDNEIQSLRDELEHARRAEKRARSMIDQLEQELFEKKHELLLKVNECQVKQQEIEKLEHKLSATVNEETDGARKITEVELLEDAPNKMEEKVKEQEEQIKKLKEDLDSSIEEGLGLREALQSAEAKLVDVGSQNRVRIKQLVTNHAEELSSTRNEIQFNKQEVKELYLSLIDEPDSSVDELSHSQLVAESKRITESLKEQLKHEQVRSSDLESTLVSKINEHDQLDAQFQAEHEEEVKALRQQKQVLVRQLEEIKSHYQQALNDQEKQNSVILQTLESHKTDMEKQLREKTEESYHVYQQVADLMEEKKVLMDIVHQLCVEAGRQIDVV